MSSQDNNLYLCVTASATRNVGWVNVHLQRVCWHLHQRVCSAAKVVLVPAVWFDDSPLDVPCCEFLRSTYLIMASRYSYSLNSWCYDAARFKHLFLLDRPICPLRVSGAVSEWGKDYSERCTLLHPYFIAVNEKYLWSKAEFTPNSALCQKRRFIFNESPCCHAAGVFTAAGGKHRSRSPCLTAAANHVPSDPAMFIKCDSPAASLFGLLFQATATTIGLGLWHPILTTEGHWLDICASEDCCQHC